jgi:hypothetical protein
MLAYSWEFLRFKCYQTLNGMSKVVFAIDWRYSADDGLGNTAVLYGTQEVPVDGIVEFVEFADLTPEIIAGWIEGALGMDGITALQAILSDAINLQINPPVLSLDAPWAS